jgi:small subunit ribosomal protein S17e
LWVSAFSLSLLVEELTLSLFHNSHTNKKICDEVAIIPSKRLRNKIAGFTTHLMKRIQKGPVRGISFKLQEEERERKDNFGESLPSSAISSRSWTQPLRRTVPEVSALDTQGQAIDVDPDTKVRFLSGLPPLPFHPLTHSFAPKQDLLKSLGFDALPVNVVAPSTAYERPQRRGVPGAARQRRDDA